MFRQLVANALYSIFVYEVDLTELNNEARIVGKSARQLYQFVCTPMVRMPVMISIGNYNFRLKLAYYFYYPKLVFFRI